MYSSVCITLFVIREELSSLLVASHVILQERRCVLPTYHSSSCKMRAEELRSAANRHCNASLINIRLYVCLCMDVSPLSVSLCFFVYLRYWCLCRTVDGDWQERMASVRCPRYACIFRARDGDEAGMSWLRVGDIPCVRVWAIDELEV